ncbi:MAG: hypothetical protein V4671_02095 [Armatimonadota bacterium]
MLKAIQFEIDVTLEETRHHGFDEVLLSLKGLADDLGIALQHTGGLVGPAAAYGKSVKAVAVAAGQLA